jgi:hypothetical protein
MEITLTTPAILFPAITLLLLAYTNRFIVLANIIRSLYAEHQKNPSDPVLGQIKNLRYRVVLVRNMQATGVFSLLLCVITMLLVYGQFHEAAKIAFLISLLFFAISLIQSLWEILISVEALNLHLRAIEDTHQLPHPPA